MLTFIIIIIVFLVIVRALRSSEAIGNWSHLFLNMTHDPKEFYQKIESLLQAHEIPSKTKQRIFQEGSIFSHNRLYLEVASADYIFHICAAPWGKGFFFSWWLRQNLSGLDEILNLIPWIGPRIVAARQYKSYYKLDTDTMFRTSVHKCILAAIDDLTEAQGVRGLTELERQPDLRAAIRAK